MVVRPGRTLHGLSFGETSDAVRMNDVIFWLGWSLGVGLFLLCLFAKLYVPSADAQLPPVSNLVFPLSMLLIVGVIRFLRSSFKERLRAFNLTRILYPELDLFETSEERDAALHTAKKARHRQSKYWLVSAIPVAMAYPAANMLMAILSRHNVGRILRLLVMFGYIVVLSLAMRYAINRAFRAPVRRALRKELAERGVAICVECGYDLRGQPVPRCSECGTPFDERIGA